MSEAVKRIGRPPIYTKEERALRDRESQRRSDKKRLANLTPEQRQRRREADARYKKSLPKTEERLAKSREYSRTSRAKRAAERTPEEVAQLRGKKRAYNQSYVLTSEQIEARNRRSREWAKANRERINARRAELRAVDPTPVRLHRAKRRALERQQLGFVSPDVVSRLFQLQRGLCACCGGSLRGGHELDHIEPLSRGGMHDDCNLQLLCRTCNRSKGAQDPIAFANTRGRLL